MICQRLAALRDFDWVFVRFGSGATEAGEATPQRLSALPPKADKEQTCRHVRFAPKADNHADASLGSLSAINGLVHCSKQRAWVALFDHFVGDGEDTRRNGKAERFGSLEIDDQLEFSRLLHRKIDWFHAA